MIAQIDAVADPSNPKDAAFFAAGTPVPPGSPKGMTRVERPEGVLFTNNPDKAKFFANEPALTDAHMASLLDYPETKERAAASGNAVVVQATDKSGAAVVDMLASPQGVPAAEQVAEAQKPPGGDVRVMTPEEGQQIRAEGHAEPPPPTGVSFTTAKGSTYQVHDDGSTTRNKSYHPEHGEADQGPQPRSEATIYVTPEHADQLSLFQAKGGPQVAIDQVPDNSGRWGVKYLDGKDAGKFERRTVDQPATEPAVGLIPVEVWKDGTRVHFGNPITEVRGVDREAKPETSPAAETKPDLVNSPPDLANSPEPSRPAAILADRDARGAPDAEYKAAFSTGAREPLKRGETWRDRLVNWVTQVEGKAPEPTGAFWWDNHLTDTGRDLVMKTAGLSRSKKIKWKYLTDTERGKLEAARGAAEERIAPAPKPAEPPPAAADM